MIHWSKLPTDEFVFTHRDNEGNTMMLAMRSLQRESLRFLQTDLIMKAIIPVDVAQAKNILRTRGIERHRLNRIDSEILQRSSIDLIDREDGTHLITDGNHRYVRAAQLGFREIKAIIYRKALWQEFVVDGVPDDVMEKMLGGFSFIF